MMCSSRDRNPSVCEHLVSSEVSIDVSNLNALPNDPKTCDDFCSVDKIPSPVPMNLNGYVIVHTGKVESRVRIAGRCTSWEKSSGAENLV